LELCLHITGRSSESFLHPLQEVYGQAKETAADAAEAIREAGSEAGDFLRTTIEERPYTTAAIALGIGYLIGRFGHRPY
jgi:ElaB/YqjD/DUF883 family membrane-anchored ribosome-binding protein